MATLCELSNLEAFITSNTFILLHIYMQCVPQIFFGACGICGMFSWIFKCVNTCGSLINNFIQSNSFICPTVWPSIGIAILPDSKVHGANMRPIWALVFIHYCLFCFCWGSKGGGCWNKCLYDFEKWIQLIQPSSQLNQIDITKYYLIMNSGTHKITPIAVTSSKLRYVRIQRWVLRPWLIFNPSNMITYILKLFICYIGPLPPPPPPSILSPQTYHWTGLVFSTNYVAMEACWPASSTCSNNYHTIHQTVLYFNNIQLSFWITWGLDAVEHRS